jgi:hypothetical protein
LELGVEDDEDVNVEDDEDVEDGKDVEDDEDVEDRCRLRLLLITATELEIGRLDALTKPVCGLFVCGLFVCGLFVFDIEAAVV